MPHDTGTVLFGLGTGCAMAMRQVPRLRPSGLILCNPAIPESLMDGVLDLDVPVLIVAGRREGTAMQVAERLHALCRRSQLVVIDAGGQNLVRNRPADVATLLAQWLPTVLK